MAFSKSGLWSLAVGPADRVEFRGKVLVLCNVDAACNDEMRNYCSAMLTFILQWVSLCYAEVVGSVC